MRHDDFSVIKVIGRGAFGEVQLVGPIPEPNVSQNIILYTSLMNDDWLTRKLKNFLKLKCT
jgi:hypothetical protein